MLPICEDGVCMEKINTTIYFYDKMIFIIN
ncbi:MAG: hypothetical protein K0R57_5636 [Paenibacillaceae bacterium]|jgi:hypothetical protein|nr:hypothetical protein [Paenibacillaceae bacterium]